MLEEFQQHVLGRHELGEDQHLYVRVTLRLAKVGEEVEERPSFRVGSSRCSVLCLLQQSGEFGAFGRPRRPLGVDEHLVLVFTSELGPLLATIDKQRQLVATLAQRGRTTLKCSQDRSRARRHEALHQQHQEGCRVPLVALGGIPSVAHVLGDRLIQFSLEGSVRIGRYPNGGLALLEQRPPVVIDGAPLLRPCHAWAYGRSLHRKAAVEPRVDQTQEPPEAIALPRVRRR